MVDGAANKPYLAQRYEILAGDRDQRLVVYLLCSRCHLTVDEVKALPWWQYDLLLEGCVFDVEREANLAGAGGEQTEEVADVTDLGFNVRTVPGA